MFFSKKNSLTTVLSDKDKEMLDYLDSALTLTAKGGLHSFSEYKLLEITYPYLNYKKDMEDFANRYTTFGYIPRSIVFIKTALKITFAVAFKTPIQSDDKILDTLFYNHLNYTNDARSSNGT